MKANLAPMEKRAFSIAELCRSFGISKSTLYKMIRNGTGPKLMRVGDRTLVSVEAVDEWRKRLEGEAA